jgi:hypothetical protein
MQGMLYIGLFNVLYAVQLSTFRPKNMKPIHRQATPSLTTSFISRCFWCKKRNSYPNDLFRAVLRDLKLFFRNCCVLGPLLPILGHFCQYDVGGSPLILTRFDLWPKGAVSWLLAFGFNEFPILCVTCSWRWPPTFPPFSALPGKESLLILFAASSLSVSLASCSFSLQQAEQFRTDVVIWLLFPSVPFTLFAAQRLGTTNGPRKPAFFITTIFK